MRSELNNKETTEWKINKQETHYAHVVCILLKLWEHPAYAFHAKCRFVTRHNWQLFRSVVIISRPEWISAIIFEFCAVRRWRCTYAIDGWCHFQATRHSAEGKLHVIPSVAYRLIKFHTIPLINNIFHIAQSIDSSHSWRYRAIFITKSIRWLSN